MSRGRGKTNTIHLAGCREEFLDRLSEGATITAAAESIGANYKSAQRYIAEHPEFEAAVIEARSGLRRERPPQPVPVAIARVVLEAEPVDAAPRDEPPPQPRAMRLGPTRDDFEEALALNLANPESRHHGKALEICARYFYGPEMLAQLRQVERDMSKPLERPTISAGRARVLEAVTRARQSE